MRKLSSLSVVLPAFNEEENLPATVDSVAAAVPAVADTFEVIVVNDGSSDATGRVLTELASQRPWLRVVTHGQNRGYGAALGSGFAAARMDCVFFMDSDGQFDPQELPRLVMALANADVVTGYRANRRDSFVRKLNATLYNVVVVRGLFGTHVRDVNCAFKIYSRSFIQSCLPLVSGGALVNCETFLKARQAGLRIAEVPITHYPRRFGTQTGANLLVILRMFVEAFKLASKLKIAGRSATHTI